MQQYSCGLLFDDARTKVALIQKLKGGAHMIGRWNGVGGKLEPGEHPHQAMVREFAEEAGVVVAGWKHFLVLCGDDWEVHFFHASSTDHLNQVSTCEEEPIGIFSLGGLPAAIMPNMRWIIPMALAQEDSRVYTVIAPVTSGVRL